MINIIKYGINLAKHKLRDIGKPKRSGQWRTVEKKFLEQHNSCAACGGKKNLQVHHEKPFHLAPKDELNTDNLITLCMSFGRECHLQIGHLGSFRRYNPNVKEDAEKALKHPDRFEEIVLLAKKNAKVN
jgi:5-methylcytosine-specific restriction enzyme A